jgi:stage II sporulation protein R
MGKVLLMIKEMGSRRTNNIAMKIATLLVLVMVIMITAGAVAASYSNKVNEGIADNVIRLHVLANSDSEEDQALKQDVRDVVINYMKDQLKNSQNLGQTRSIINQNLGRITEIASAEVKRNGKNYKVKCLLGNYPFPTKSYGDVTLPAGQYEALRVVIGKGEGANWWCVLFPPLCFVDATHGTIPDSVKEDLKEALTQEEYNLITTADSDNDIPVKVRFKIVEVFQSSKVRFTGIISNLFKTGD